MEEYQEITLADIVRTLYKRKLILAGVFLLCLVGGVAVTVFATPEYESTSSLMPFQHPDIIKNWLESRNASAVVVDDLGDPLRRELAPGAWNPATSNWTNGPPNPEGLAASLAGRTTVSTAVDVRFAQSDRLIKVTVQMTDPLLARDAANAYVRSLDVLRPTLERATENTQFASFYEKSGNPQEARREAEIIAQNSVYWIILDDANTPGGPSSPNVTLNIALSTVLGLMLGVFAVFIWEWMRNFRAEAKPVQVPAAVEKETRKDRRYA